MANDPFFSQSEATTADLTPLLEAESCRRLCANRCLLSSEIDIDDTLSLVIAITAAALVNNSLWPFRPKKAGYRFNGA